VKLFRCRVSTKAIPFGAGASEQSWALVYVRDTSIGFAVNRAAGWAHDQGLVLDTVQASEVVEPFIDFNEE